MRILRYTLPGLPICWGVVLCICFLLTKVIGSDAFFSAFFVTLLVSIYVFYPYGSAWSDAAEAQLQHGLELSIAHWTIVFVVYLLLSRKLNDRRAMILGCSLSIVSVLIAYAVLGTLGYNVEFHIDF